MTETTPERRRRNKAFWNEKAGWNYHVAIYDTEEVRDPVQRDAAFEAAGQEDARRLAWFVNPEMRVVDLGCGVGRVIRPLAPYCREVVGVDVSEEMLGEAERYLAGVDNTRLVATDGASLPTIEDGSVDFLYSLLCLIHVDKRSAYRYLQEARRVLVPGGLALLQFQDILTAEGLDKFRSVLDQDYPLEFYAPDEISWLLESVGLEVLSTHPTAEYLFVTALRGPAAAWRNELAAATSIDVSSASGPFAGDGAGGLAGELTARVRCALDAPRTFLATVDLGAADGAGRLLHASAVMVTRPGRTHELGISISGDGAVRFLFDGEPASLQRAEATGQRPSGAARLHVGLLPSGFPPTEETLALFPALFSSRELIF